MAKRMLIDATHPEEIRVAVVSGSRLDEFDFETSTKKQLKGNIYLAKVTRVEPSLQAAFVDYGGNRHGFLAFSEIHPDYYRVPISDREALLAADGDRDDGEAAEENQVDTAPPGRGRRRRKKSGGNGLDRTNADRRAVRAVSDAEVEEDDEEENPRDVGEVVEELAGVDDVGDDDPDAGDDMLESLEDEEIENLRRRNKALSRKYRIQEVISRRQILLVQVAKEERGNKGAALTTYISLAGRYCVLMPNTPRGGGISRKITNPADRKRLKSILEDLKIPDGMAVIVRTAGMERTKAEIKRDYEYLIKLWDNVRERTLNSTAPALINEEANLIRRSIRDLYSKEIDEIFVEGEDGYKTAKTFMKMLVPSHAKRVKRYEGDGIPLFQRYQVEQQIDDVHNPVVQLKSGGYLVISSTEALVAIDVNSGRSTRERNIEETAFRTNLEAADEVARQLRLRDLAGLIVIDFIDMDEYRNRSNVEKRLKEAMRSDRARIQLGRISPFGLLEMSRQRLRPSLIEASMEVCPMCGGVGHVRSVESTALHVLRAIDEEGMRRRSRQLTVYVPTRVALYILNQKRNRLTEIERRDQIEVLLANDDSLVPPGYRIERSDMEGRPVVEEADKGKEAGSGRRRRSRRRPKPEAPEAEDVAARELLADDKAEDRDAGKSPGGDDEDGGRARKPRRRGRRGGRRRRDRDRREDLGAADQSDQEAPAPDGGAPVPANDEAAVGAAPGATAETAKHNVQDEPPKKRGRRRKAVEEAPSPTADQNVADGAEPASEDAETSPKKRKRTRKAPAKKTRSTGVEGDTVSPAVTAAELDNKSAAEPEKKRGRRPATRKSAAAAEERPKPRRTTRRKKIDDAPPKAAAVATAEPEGAPPAGKKRNRDDADKPSAGEPTEKPAEPRTGWWQRLVD